MFIVFNRNKKYLIVEIENFSCIQFVCDANGLFNLLNFKLNQKNISKYDNN